MTLERGVNSIDGAGGFLDAKAYLNRLRNLGNIGDRAVGYHTGKCSAELVLQE
jgi:hypothetical protein